MCAVSNLCLSSFGQTKTDANKKTDVIYQFAGSRVIIQFRKNMQQLQNFKFCWKQQNLTRFIKFSEILKKFFFHFLFWIPKVPAMFKIINRNTKTRCKTCSKLTKKIPEGRQWRRSGAFIVKFEQISQLVLVFLLLTLSR